MYKFLIMCICVCFYTHVHAVPTAATRGGPETLEPDLYSGYFCELPDFRGVVPRALTHWAISLAP